MLHCRYEVEALVEMCLAIAQALTRPGVEMVASVPPNLPTAYSDQDKIRQILLNTLCNAAKFTHDGEILLSCELQDASGELQSAKDELQAASGELQQGDHSPLATHRLFYYLLCAIQALA